MMTQKKMDNDLKKFLWGQFINGNTRLENLNPKDVLKRYNFNISQEDLDERATHLLQLFVTLYSSSQLPDSDKEMWEDFKKAEDKIKCGYDFSKYTNMTKAELGSYIYTYEGVEGTEQIIGQNLISDNTERLLASFYYESKFVTI